MNLLALHESMKELLGELEVVDFGVDVTAFQAQEVEVQIELYEQQGIEWEYKVDGYSGDENVVPKANPDRELDLI